MSAPEPLASASPVFGDGPSAAPPFTLRIEPPLLLARTAEVALLRQAVARNPGSVPLRAKLAFLLFIHDGFDEAAALYDQLMADDPRADWAIMQAECHLSRETPADDAAAERCARAGVALADHDLTRGHALAGLGKALTRLGRLAEARAALLDALDASPGDRNAYKRLASLDLQAGAAEAALDVADRLMGRGVAHSRLLVARALALASLGRVEQARDAVGLERFLHREILAAPPGWPDLAALNAAVREELHRHPDLRFDRYGTASTKTWRIDQPVFAASVAIPALQERIREAILTHVAALDDQDAVWTRARPADAELHNWCVLTDAEGYEEWHVHQNGWMSGVYYVDVPPAVVDGTGDEGCIAFGLPENLVGPEVSEEFGRTVVRPEPGLLMLFPSHAYHRTYAHGSDRRRICLAFDVIRA
ncbi:MAG: tetratricopeptide repeat protein [Alphaproteobacteria bacterium]|nr:tetratricopeptide repeat protein [Alphaproteobacteria bacterium]MBU1525157.1 tetratricopeptide repeat protein [Alphaproteobacteria bacterium]MBU2352153.1 tetratricopeptide repeat protein [Alphaproteobacteria bacterium]MBU2381163.1 tetratricopeptide repeat protein [Alphaproteobacteria bacterium]